MTNPPVLLQLLAQRLDGGGLLTTSKTWIAGLEEWRSNEVGQLAQGLSRGARRDS